MQFIVDYSQHTRANALAKRITGEQSRNFLCNHSEICFPVAYLCNVSNTSRTLHFYSIGLSSRTRLLITCHKPSRDDNRSQNWCSASLRVLRFKSPSYRKVVAIPQLMALINPRLVRKKQGFAGVRYIT